MIELADTTVGVGQNTVTVPVTLSTAGEAPVRFFYVLEHLDGSSPWPVSAMQPGFGLAEIDAGAGTTRLTLPLPEHAGGDGPLMLRLRLFGLLEAVGFGGADSVEAMVTLPDPDDAPLRLDQVEEDRLPMLLNAETPAAIGSRSAVIDWTLA